MSLGCLKTRKLLPYLIALLLLAWILGSLARSGTGGSLLSNSYWLVYTVELLPLVALGLMVVLAIYIAVNWRLLSDVLGFGMRQKRRNQQRKNHTVRNIVFLASWAIAIMILWLRCGGLVCNNSTQNEGELVKEFVSAPGTFPQLPALAPVLAIASLVDTNLFILAFYGVLAISSVIMVRAFKVSWDQERSERLDNILLVQEQGREAVQDAIKVLDEDENGDPRTRIMLSYERMIKAAAHLGAPMGPDKTARELEKGIRGMFLLKGPGIVRLTRLFEEARYSIHPVWEEDARMARECLMEIQEELSRTVSLEA